MARYVGLGDVISDARSAVIDSRARLKQATTVATKEQALTNLLRVIGQLIVAYRQQGNEALAQRWMEQYRALQNDAAQVRALISANEAPSQIMLAMDRFGDRAIGFVDTVVKSAEGVVGGVGVTARMLPLLLPLALVAAVFVIGKGGLGTVVRRNPRRRHRRRRR